MRRSALVVAVCAIVVLCTRLPYRSNALFSWDGANFALATRHIDLATHRPHPPGYVGYVMAGRLLQRLTGETNSALVLWNVLATMAIVLILARFARRLAPPAAGRRAAVSAALLVITSPLVWFYGEVAEIYISELLGTLLIAYLAWEAANRSASALNWCSLVLAVTALFKPTAAILMFFLYVHAWRQATPQVRSQAAGVLLASTAGTIIVFLSMAPDVVNLSWRQFTEATSESRPLLDGRELLERFTQNGRSTVLALIGGVGIPNVLALAVWAGWDRQLPSRLDKRFTALWLVPWLVLFLGIHIAKPGYVLPVLPISWLILSAFYAGFKRNAWLSILALAAGGNLVYFCALKPFAPELTGGRQPYRSKSILQRALSDAQPLTFPTAWTIRDSDAKVKELHSAVSRVCPRAVPLIVAGAENVDARRVMWYFPHASVLYVEGAQVIQGRIQRQFVQPGALPEQVVSDCNLLWVDDASNGPPQALPPNAVPLPGVGFLLPARAVRIKSSRLVFD